MTLNSPIYNNKKGILVKKTVYIALAYLLSIVLLVALMPRQKKIAFDYEEGRPWKHLPLIANYDFPVYKSEATIAMERDSAMKTFQPFYSVNMQTAQIEVRLFRADYKKGMFQKVPDNYAHYVAEMLAKVYQAGIVSTEGMSELMRNGSTAIRIVNGKEAVSTPVSGIYSTRTAYEYIMHNDTINYRRDILMRCNINNYLTQNLLYDVKRTDGAKADLISSISAANGMVLKGQRIIDRGEIVSARQKQLIDSYTKESKRRSEIRTDFWEQVSGQALLVFLILGFFPIYLKMFRPDYIRSTSTLLFFFTLLVLFPLLTYSIVRFSLSAVYIIPYAIVPFFIRIFLDSRTATMALIVVVLLSAIGVQMSFEFILLQLYMGLTAIYGIRELTQRSQIIRVVGLVFIVGMVAQLAQDMLEGLSFSQLSLYRYLFITFSCIQLLFAYPLMYLIERVFRFTSSVTLIELTNINHPLLRRMSKVAQGTLNHSMQVSNLAAEVALKIGASSQLVRTGALYHDIGKMLNPLFFTENQNGVNPHDALEAKDGFSKEERSAQIIIGHVTEGLRLAEKHHLPKSICNFIRTHHGRGKVKYFYIQWQNEHPDETPRDALFTYPGPNPTTKEQAILMMCDAVEASSRSLKEYTKESLTELVNRIIDTQVADGAFLRCPITFRDISDAKDVLIDNLKTIYHTRIAYPTLHPHQEERPTRTRRRGGSLFTSLRRNS